MSENELLKKLISHLCRQQEDTTVIDEIVTICADAKNDPEEYFMATDEDMAWIMEVDPNGLTAYILVAELYDYFAVSDKLDELHEKVQDLFEDNDIAGFPYDKNLRGLNNYITWLRTELEKQQLKLTPILFGDSYGDDLQLIFINDEHLKETFDLCTALGIRTEKIA